MRALVTGATGFIGSCMVPALVDQGNDVVATDIVAEPRWITSRKGVEYRRVDLCHDPDVRELVFQERPDKVVHLAGLPFEECEESPSRGFQVNLMATFSLLEASVTSDVARFVMTSSLSVFGRGLAEPVLDDAERVPESVHGQTKLACEHMLDWFRRVHGFSVGAVRFPWVYGPGRTTGLSAEHSSFLLDAIARDETAIVRNADQVGDWLYVRDAVKALILLLESDEDPPVTYNIASGIHSVADAMAVAQELFPDARVEIRRVPGADYPYASSFDDTRARKRIGWNPGYSIRRGFKEHVEEVRRSLAVA
ncbi:MAG: NAD(P)-dependent oxidoreductase [Boseongicola sp. SB0662_bin_57]|nr:NAD(P)-dependent oxidoreductase [Boseongicola sp. SB0662_bin_57]